MKQQVTKGDIIRRHLERQARPRGSGYVESIELLFVACFFIAMAAGLGIAWLVVGGWL